MLIFTVTELTVLTVQKSALSQNSGIYKTAIFKIIEIQADRATQKEIFLGLGDSVQHGNLI
jgi:hypothetical protein